MALVLADRVLETSTSEGLGTFALAGAQTGYQTFSNGIGNGNTCYYTINGQTTEQWEVGIGTVGAGTLARTTLISSNTGSFINFVAGVKNVFVTQPASKSIYKDASGNAIPLGSASATQLDITAQGDLRLQDTTGGEYVALQAPATLAASYTLTMPTDDGTSGQALVTDGSGVLSWSTAASGDVYGPASATDNAVARFDLTTGKLIQNSVVTIDDTGNMAGVGTLSSGAITSSSLTSGRVPFAGTAGLIQDAAALTFDGTILSATRFAGALNGTVGATTPSTGAFTTLSATGITTVAAGSAALPAIVSTTGTADTGFWFPAADTIAASTAGTERMRIDSAGNVGIGTTTPFAKLNIKTLDATNAAIIAGTTIGARFSSDAAGIYIDGTDPTGSASYQPLFAGGSIFGVRISGVEKMRIDASGNVGIGTTTPRVPLAFAATVGTAGVPTKIRLFDDGASNFYGFGISIGSLDVVSGTGGAITLYANGATERLRVASTGVISLGAAVGSESLRVTPVASAVNYLNVFGRATGAAPYLQAEGSDTNIDLLYSAKGTGAHVFYSAGGSFTPQFRIAHTASAVNYLQVTGAATAGGPALSAQGSDTNIDLALTPKGTGVLAFGTHTAGIVAQAGYITIKDAGGTTRRLLVG